MINFFEDKINFLLGITDKQQVQKILDDNLLNFYFSHITAMMIFSMNQTIDTDKYIWRYLSSVKFN